MATVDIDVDVMEFFGVCEEGEELISSYYVVLFSTSTFLFITLIKQLHMKDKFYFIFQRYIGHMSTTSFKNSYVLEIFLVTKNF